MIAIAVSNERDGERREWKGEMGGTVGALEWMSDCGWVHWREKIRCIGATISNKGDGDTSRKHGLL